jgi:hypothetical protein
VTVENIADFRNIKKDINEESDILQEIEEEARRKTKQSIEVQNTIENINHNHRFIVESINDISEDSVKTMSETDYSYSIKPYQEWRPSGGTVNELLVVFNRNDSAMSMIGSTAVALSSTATLVASEINTRLNTNPSLYPQRNNYTPSFNEESDINKDIDSIREELPKITPNILDDFNNFIIKFQTFKDNSSRYQELIGFRTTLFFKLIFRFAEDNNVILTKNGGAANRMDQIRYFATKSITPLPITEIHVNSAKALWDEFSSQDTSVKMGNVSDAEINSLYRKCLSNLNSLLVIRKIYYH